MLRFFILKKCSSAGRMPFLLLNQQHQSTVTAWNGVHVSGWDIPAVCCGNYIKKEGMKSFGLSHENTQDKNEWR